MVVAPKYKHYDGLNFAGETRVRINDQEARQKMWPWKPQKPFKESTPKENVKYWHLRKDYGEAVERCFVDFTLLALLRSQI